MTTNADDTSVDTSGAPDDAAATAAADAGAKAGADQVSLLTGRLNGQTAKVGELTTQKTAAETALAKALERIADLEGGKVSADEAANARVAALQAQLDAEQKARTLADRKARFPETFGSIGDTAAALDEVALAAIEARLLGEVAGEDLPTPLRHNETKTGTPRQPAKEPTAADAKATLLATPIPW